MLTQGNKIPADLRLIAVNMLKIDKSSVTGESLPVSGSVESTDARAFDSCNVALMGTVYVSPHSPFSPLSLIPHVSSFAPY